MAFTDREKWLLRKAIVDGQFNDRIGDPITAELLDDISNMPDEKIRGVLKMYSDTLVSQLQGQINKNIEDNVKLIEELKILQGK